MTETKIEENIIEFPVEKVACPDSTSIGEVCKDSSLPKQKMEDNTAESFIKVGSCEEVIVECLLKHYKCLSFLSVRFTWLGIHKIYRVALVACRTFITEPVKRLYII